MRLDPNLASVLAALLIAASTAPCAPRDPTDPHPPSTADERMLADRYRAFARALDQGDAQGVCRALSSALARSYRCGSRGGLRVPTRLRGVTVTDEIFAASDPLVPGVIQLSAPRRRGGGSLIVFFRRHGTRDWRIDQASIGGYG